MDSFCCTRRVVIISPVDAYRCDSVHDGSRMKHSEPHVLSPVLKDHGIHQLDVVCLFVCSVAHLLHRHSQQAYAVQLLD